MHIVIFINYQQQVLRFFTVYGPWGRPDMALFKFTKNILEEKPIDVFNHGNIQEILLILMIL
jgi:nucleoside-diphosphate-sugar epimerase